jgi:ribonucleotide monophosphatase NagD (HAD superfamily)
MHTSLRTVCAQSATARALVVAAHLPLCVSQYLMLCFHITVQGCTGVEPTVVGKPSPLMIDYMVEKFKVDRSRICMVSSSS